MIGRGRIERLPLSSSDNSTSRTSASKGHYEKTSLTGLIWGSLQHWRGVLDSMTVTRTTLERDKIGSRMKSQAKSEASKPEELPAPVADGEG